jgi:hypothetical protein
MGWLFDMSLQTINIPPNRTQILDLTVGPGQNPTTGFIRMTLTNTATQQVQSRVFALQTN